MTYPYLFSAVQLPVRSDEYLAKRARITEACVKNRFLHIEQHKDLIDPITLDAISHIDNDSILLEIYRDYGNQYQGIDPSVSIEGHMVNAQFMCGLNIEEPDRLLNIISAYPDIHTTNEIKEGLILSSIAEKGGLCSDEDTNILLKAVSRLSYEELESIGQVKPSFMPFMTQNISFSLINEVILLSDRAFPHFLKYIDVAALDNDQLATFLVNIRKTYSSMYHKAGATTEMLLTHMDTILNVHPHWAAIKEYVLATESIAEPPFLDEDRTFSLICGALHTDSCVALPDTGLNM